MQLGVGDVVVELAEENEVDGDVLLLQLLGQRAQLLLLFLDGGANEDYYPLSLRSVLTVLEGELSKRVSF